MVPFQREREEQEESGREHRRLGSDQKERENNLGR